MPSQFPLGGVLCFALACGAPPGSESLQRSVQHFRLGRYDRAHALLRLAEAQAITPVDLDASYCYLRGMTEFRLGEPTAAKYWLGLAEVLAPDARREGRAFRPEWLARLQAARRRLAEGSSLPGQDALQVIEAPLLRDTQPPSPTP